MGGHLRKRAFRFAALSIAVAAATPVAGGIAAAAEPSAAPATLIGQWTRKVTSADVKRTGGFGIPAGTVCTLTIKKSGVAHLGCTNIGGFDGNIVPAGANRVDIKLGLPEPDVYRWRVSGRLLTFIKLKDTVADREAAMEGVWKRK